MIWETDSTPINQNINTIPQKKQKLKKAESTCREPLTPQRTSTYKRPFHILGYYLCLYTYGTAVNKVKSLLKS